MEKGVGKDVRILDAGREECSPACDVTPACTVQLRLTAPLDRLELWGGSGHEGLGPH